MILYPNEYLDNVTDITADLLTKNNIKGVVLDVDNTLIDLDKNLIKGVENWIEDLKKIGIKFCIVSNSNNLEKVKNVAKILDIPFIYFAKKPLKFGFKKASKVLELKLENMSAVGDLILTDVVGANRCNMFSILVKPVNEKDYLITRIKRPLEKKIISRLQKELKRLEWNVQVRY